MLEISKTTHPPHVRVCETGQIVGPTVARSALWLATDICEFWVVFQQHFGGFKG